MDEILRNREIQPAFIIHNDKRGVAHRANPAFAGIHELQRHVFVVLDQVVVEKVNENKSIRLVWKEFDNNIRPDKIISIGSAEAGCVGRYEGDVLRAA